MTSNFVINGKPYSVNLAELPADITLNTFIRDHVGLPATKFMCQEGGCGVCICAVTQKHPVTGEISTFAVNSCLTLLNTCDGSEITTSEGIGNKRDGYHAIQKRLSKMNGTQCGYCSPGFVMNMYALLESNGGKVTMEQVENSFGGNICRCTGYRPILDAMKSFAVDSNIEIPAECRDIEDLSNKTCPKTSLPCSGNCKVAAKRSPVTYIDGSQWFWPKSLNELFEIFDSLKSAEYTLIAGNTAHGVYRRSIDTKIYIDINGISELKQHNITNDAITLGANVSLTEAMAIFKNNCQKKGFEYCAQLWNHFDLIANVPVRNAGTIAGNLSIKHQRNEFPSDIFVSFDALDVKVVVNETATIQKTLSLLEYLKTPMHKKVITKLILKSYAAENYIFDSYKIMQRAQNTHAYVNAAFLVEVNQPNNKVRSARICYGGINPDFTHANIIENVLVDKDLYDKKLLESIFQLFKNQIKPDFVLPDASPEYRLKLAYNLFYKFLLAHAPKGNVGAKFLSGGPLLKRPISSGQQRFDKIEKEFPIFQPTEKHEGLLQTAGEAVFANDVPPQVNQVWVALVTAKEVGAKVIDIDTTEAFKLRGVIAFYAAKDIPGQNAAGVLDKIFFQEHEELFVSGTVKFYNQPVGIIVAETNDLAYKAAELVKLKYSDRSNNVLPTLKDVLNSACTERITHTMKSLIEKLEVKEKPDLRGSGQLNMGLQYHFFMEPHTTVAIPCESGLQINSATQFMDLVQIVVANTLNLKNNEVQVKTRRIGGGYGGKASRCNLAACAAALAAYKLGRPARFVQSLESMMNTLGKRWACLVEYDFYAKADGKIIALESTFYEDAGYNRNESPMGHTVLLSKNCYEFSDNFKLDGHLVITDSPTNVACRAPGSVEGIAIIETIMEQIAFEAGIDPVEVRMKNLIPCHKMEEMLQHFLKTTDYKLRKNEISAFNEKNRWRKKGLGFALSEYHIGYFGQYSATVAVYHGDGTVVISHGGIEMGQGMNTKVSQVAARILGIPLDTIKVEGSDTLNGANSMVTGGSIGSEQICFAVRKCCNTINERLSPIKESLKNPSWQELVAEAYEQKINMIVSDDCKHNDMDPYTVCGLGLAEVEVDMLTGNYLVKRMDILEDTGESLNPNIDIGQIEGAFTMGLGYWTTEQVIVDSSTGELKTNRSWNYKPPGARDIPIDLRIELLPKSSNSAGFMGSKATGEPAICLSVAVAFALQEALQSARDNAGLKKSWVPITAPMTPEYILLNSGTDSSMLSF